MKDAAKVEKIRAHLGMLATSQVIHASALTSYLYQDARDLLEAVEARDVEIARLRAEKADAEAQWQRAMQEMIAGGVP